MNPQRGTATRKCILPRGFGNFDKGLDNSAARRRFKPLFKMILTHQNSALIITKNGSESGD